MNREESNTSHETIIEMTDGSDDSEIIEQGRLKEHSIGCLR